MRSRGWDGDRYPLNSWPTRSGTYSDLVYFLELGLIPEVAVQLVATGVLAHLLGGT